MKPCPLCFGTGAQPPGVTDAMADRNEIIQWLTNACADADIPVPINHKLIPLLEAISDPTISYEQKDN